MIRLSTAFSEVLYVLWRGRGTRGPVKALLPRRPGVGCLARIEYPPFDPDKLVDPGATAGRNLPSAGERCVD